MVKPEAWEEILKQFESGIFPVTAGDDIAKTVPQVLELAYRKWQMGQRTPWFEAVPYYGQHPVE